MRFVVAFQELCNGQQVCMAVADGSSSGELCPDLGSYLSVEYHCKNRERSFIFSKVQYIHAVNGKTLCATKQACFYGSPKKSCFGESYILCHNFKGIKNSL